MAHVIFSNVYFKHETILTLNNVGDFVKDVRNVVKKVLE